MKRISFLFLFLASLFFVSCDKESGYDVAFLGNRYVANWNLEESFPNLQTKKFADKDESGLKYLSNLKGVFKNSDVVLLLGNSDLTELAEKNDPAVNEYCTKLVDYAKNLGSNNIYIYSFLPQNYSNETTTIRMNKFIISVNAVLKQKVNAAGLVYVDCHSDFFNGTTIKPDLINSDGNSYSKVGYNLLASKLVAVLK